MKNTELLVIGFMPFALFVGAGNIIFRRISDCRQVKIYGLPPAVFWLRA